MADDNIDYAALREQVEEQVKQQKTGARWAFMGTSLLMFVVFTLITWTMLNADGALANENVIGPMVMMSAGWFTSLVFQFVSLMLDTKGAEASMRQQAVSRAIGSQMLARGEAALDREQKRKRTYALTDDGELEPTVDLVDVNEADAEVRRSASR